ncbi:MAG: DUF58 domain-containing protein [Clostridiales bacterium]|nr:DUF58 domain-containing protein [Clostridiales bacterium]
MKIIIFIIFLAIAASVEIAWYRKHALKKLDLDVSFSKSVASYGEIIEVIEVAKNNKRLPLPFILLKFEAPQVLEFQDMTNTTLSDLLYREDMLTMKPFSKHTRKIKAKCTARGYYSFTRVNLTTSDLLLTGKITREFPADASITILPEIIDTEMQRSLWSVTYSEVYTRRTLLTDPFSFAGIREYQPWDPMRTVNWTATARAGDLMVNTNTSTTAKKVKVILNLEYYNPKKSVSLLEKSISIAYSYVCELTHLGIPVELLTNGRDMMSGSTVSTSLNGSDSEITECGTELALIDLGKEVQPLSDLLDDYASELKRDDFVVVVSPRRDVSFRNSFLTLTKRCNSCLWVLPCYKGTHTDPSEVLPPECIKWEMPGHD